MEPSKDASHLLSGGRDEYCREENSPGPATAGRVRAHFLLSIGDSACRFDVA
jgi:hypothetical protein